MQTTVLKVTGMMCAACVGHVTQALQKVPGVAAVEVDLAQGRASVQHEAVNPTALVQAVDDDGYEAEVMVG